MLWEWTKQYSQESNWAGDLLSLKWLYPSTEQLVVAPHIQISWLCGPHDTAECSQSGSPRSSGQFREVVGSQQ